MIEPRPIIWKRAQYSLLGYIGDWHLFTIVTATERRKDGKLYRLRSTLPGIESQPLEDEEEGKRLAAQELSTWLQSIAKIAS